MIGAILWFAIVMLIVLRALNSSKKAKKPKNQTMNTVGGMINQSQYRTPVSQPDIVERAKANSQRYAKRDETLEETHGETKPGEEEPGLLGSVEDLMVKGYDGNLSFERDFIAEAQQMLSAFTLSEIWRD